MEPTYYLTHYCKINDRRKTFYKKIFEKYKIKLEKEDYIDFTVSFFFLSFEFRIQIYSKLRILFYFL
jgi:hypothetical protein